jgi:sigma-B regulation protein RsbU (phosphoserine phosphatase)
VCGADKQTRLAIADVVGHGEQVSDVSGWLYNAMAARLNESEGDSVLADVNAVACTHGLDALTTAAVVAFYREWDQIYVSYAGHPPVYTWNAGGWTAARFDHAPRGANLPLGLDEGTPYEQHETPLDRCGCVLLYSDGVLEAPNADGELFGEERLATVLREAGSEGPYEVKRRIVDALLTHTGGKLAHDDVTLLAIQVH